MSELTALDKFSCPACGAQAEWNASKHLLVCPYCGTESPAELAADSGGIVEHDLGTALRNIPDDQRGWMEEKKTVKCRSCKAVTVFSPEKVGKNCDFCGSPELIDYEEIRSPIKPESVIPFLVNREQVYTEVRAWLGSHWLAPNNLKRLSLIDTMKGIYIPYWTFDSRVHCPWKAESGDYYYETEWYTDSDGKRSTRRVRKTRWYPSSGTINHVFDDHLVPGSRGIDPKLLRQIEPFPTDELRPYDAGYVSGWDIEHYQVVLLDAAQQARLEKTEIMRGLAGSQVPGDTYRNLRIFPEFSEETFKHMLAPVWLLAYDYGHKTFQVVVNGVTGEIAGTHPLSVWKIVVLSLIAILVIGVIAFFAVGS